jgi:hypothetical protein
MEIALRSGMTNYLHARKRADGSLMLETTTGDWVVEALCGPGQHNARVYASSRISTHKRGLLGVFAVACDGQGRIAERP